MSGNERADSALTLPFTDMTISANKLIPCQFCLREWQDIWNSCEGNKLHSIPNVGKIPHCKIMLA